MKRRDYLRRLKRGQYPARPEVPAGRHGIASDPLFWRHWFDAHQAEEDAEEAAFRQRDARRARPGPQARESRHG